jgi:AraC family transcriptional regulator
MILHEFPDLGWLKSQIDQRFQQRRGYNNLPLETAGFPSVIINTSVQQSYRPDIIGPISVFCNQTGTSACRVENRSVRIEEAYYFVSNRFQSYTLEIDSVQPVETFNIHFGEYFSESVLNALLTPADKILQNGMHQNVKDGVHFYNKLYRRDEVFNNLTAALRKTQTGNSLNKLLFEEQLAALLNHLLLQHRHVIKQVEAIAAVKYSTRQELYKRLSVALDCLHSCTFENVELEQLAQAACLSKYHFLRLFRQMMGLSPHQYIQQLRLEKAKHLLKTTAVPVQDLAVLLGFENSQSFSRLFYQRMGLYPSQYRG